MPLNSGARLGSYEIVSAIGAGGMGEVYRARDTALNREVAIKILPDLFAEDPERLARFSREAQTLAALNHPNIAHVYGLEGKGLVMELVDGEDLAHRLGRGPLPLDEALPVATQIVDGLEAAHERGIVHRDLKPANIKVRGDGVVKILDFGLAKALDRSGQSGTSADSNSPTMLSPTFASGVSQAGIILGTAAYMSPEQAKGKPIDKRTDIWAFGCVLFEMLTGKMTFPGDNITEILAAVVRGEPDWTALPSDTPAPVQRLLRRCLSKDLKDRLSDIGVARLELRDAADASRSGAIAPVSPVPRRAAPSWGMLAAGLIAGMLVAGMVAWRAWPAPASSTPTLKLTIEWPDDLMWAGASGPGVALSPDGTHIAYVATTDQSGPQVYLRDLRGDEIRAVTSASDAPYNPFFSPDSSQIGYISSGKLWRAPVAGGAPFDIGNIDRNDRGVAWSADGYIYSGGGAGISRIAASGGGRREQLTTVDLAAGEIAHRFPSAVPGGRGVLFTIFKGSLEEARVAVLDLTTKKWRVLADWTGHSPAYTPTGHLVYLRSGVLMAAPFDPSRLELTGQSAPVMPGINYNSGGAAHFSISTTGTLAYISDPGRPQTDVLWIDRAGRPTSLGLPPGSYSRPELSPEGRRVALEQFTGVGKQNIVVWDVGRHSLSIVTHDSGVSETPVWMPDGAGLLFASRPQLGALGRLFRQRADGAGTPTQMTTGSLTQVYASGAESPASVSADGTKLIYSVTGTDAEGIKLLDVATGQARMLVPKGRTPRLSPDGRWLAYRSSVSGVAEIYVSPYPDVASVRWQVSTGGSTAPRWSHDSTELFYRGLGANRLVMYVVRVGGSATLAGARPQEVVRLPEPGGATGSGLEDFDVAPDGRFLVLKGLRQKPPIPHVIVNWFDVLKRAVPADGRGTK